MSDQPALFAPPTPAVVPAPASDDGNYTVMHSLRFRRRTPAGEKTAATVARLREAFEVHNEQDNGRRITVEQLSALVAALPSAYTINDVASACGLTVDVVDDSVSRLGMFIGQSLRRELRDLREQLGRPEPHRNQTRPGSQIVAAFDERIPIPDGFRRAGWQAVLNVLDGAFDGDGTVRTSLLSRHLQRLHTGSVVFAGDYAVAMLVWKLAQLDRLHEIDGLCYPDGTFRTATAETMLAHYDFMVSGLTAATAALDTLAQPDLTVGQVRTAVQTARVLDPGMFAQVMRVIESESLADDQPIVELSRSQRRLDELHGQVVGQRALRRLLDQHGTAGELAKAAHVAATIAGPRLQVVAQLLGSYPPRLPIGDLVDFVPPAVLPRLAAGASLSDEHRDRRPSYERLLGRLAASAPLAPGWIGDLTCGQAHSIAVAAELAAEGPDRPAESALTKEVLAVYPDVEADLDRLRPMIRQAVSHDKEAELFAAASRLAAGQVDWDVEFQDALRGV